MQNTQLPSNVGTQESRGRRWVRRAGLAAVRQPYVPTLFVAVAVLLGIVGVVLGVLKGDASVALMGGIYNLAMWLLVAVLYYERKNFYEIILEQEQRIAELERGLQHTRQ